MNVHSINRTRTINERVKVTLPVIVFMKKSKRVIQLLLLYLNKMIFARSIMGFFLQDGKGYILFY
jgi:hypothetical protein